MIKLGDRVKIIKISSAFYGCIGEVFKRGNGTCWEIILDNNIGVYFFESEFQSLDR